MVILGSVFVVLSAWDEVSRLRSLESREGIEKFLASDFGGRFGLSLESAIQTRQAVATVAALCAVIAIALGWQVLQRSTGARLALSVLAVPLVIAGVISGGFVSALVAAGAVVLWRSPSREWLAGLPIPEPAKRPRESMQVWEQTPNNPPGGQTRELSGSTASPVAASGWSVSADPTDHRPPAVTVAVVLTVVVSSAIFVLALIGLVLFISQPDVQLAEMRRRNPAFEDSAVTDSVLLTTVYLAAAVILLWSALTVVLAVLVAGRRAWAARALLVGAVVFAGFSLFATLQSTAALVPAFAALVTISCLRRPEVRAWFSRR